MTREDILGSYSSGNQECSIINHGAGTNLHGKTCHNQVWSSSFTAAAAGAFRARATRASISANMACSAVLALPFVMPARTLRPRARTLCSTAASTRRADDNDDDDDDDDDDDEEEEEDEDWGGDKGRH